MVQLATIDCQVTLVMTPFEVEEAMTYSRVGPEMTASEADSELTWF